MFSFLLVTSGYLVVTCGYLVVTSGHLITTTGYFLLLLVPCFSNNDIKSYMALFLQHNFEEVLVARMAANLSYNPVERFHSIANLGLQSTGLMRRPMLQNLEKLMHNANSIVSSRVGTPFSEGTPPPFLDAPLFLKQVKKVTPPLSESHPN